MDFLSGPKYIQIIPTTKRRLLCACTLDGSAYSCSSPSIPTLAAPHPANFHSRTLKFKVIIRHPACLAATYWKGQYAPKFLITLFAAASPHILHLPCSWGRNLPRDTHLSLSNANVTYERPYGRDLDAPSPGHATMHVQYKQTARLLQEYHSPGLQQFAAEGFLDPEMCICI